MSTRYASIREGGDPTFVEANPLGRALRLLGLARLSRHSAVHCFEAYPSVRGTHDGDMHVTSSHVNVASPDRRCYAPLPYWERPRRDGSVRLKYCNFESRNGTKGQLFGFGLDVSILVSLENYVPLVRVLGR